MVIIGKVSMEALNSQLDVFGGGEYTRGVRRSSLIRGDILDFDSRIALIGRRRRILLRLYDLWGLDVFKPIKRAPKLRGIICRDEN